MNLDREIRNGYTIEPEMKRVWSVQLLMVKKLLEVCAKHQLRIWASGGTMIGAVRHGGYIPWDDDIDMKMPREDYDRLVALAATEFNAPLFFQCARTERAPYPRGHAQLRYDDTSAILQGGEYDGFHQGIFIDIFPLDYVPADRDSREALSQKIASASVGFALYRRHFKFTTHLSDYAEIIRCIRKRLHTPFSAIYERYENALRSCPESGYLCMIGLNHHLEFIEKTSIPVECYKETVYFPFEDIQMPVPRGYDQILTTRYGNYMKPVQAPTMHGGFAVLSADKNYRTVVRKMLFLNFFNRLKAWKKSHFGG